MKILLTASMVLFSLAVIADDVVPVDKVKNAINVRQQPDTGSEVVARLKQGASLPLVKTVDGWYEVQLDADATGFVSADWARIVAATSDDTVVPGTVVDRVDGTGPEVAGDGDVDSVTEDFVTEESVAEEAETVVEEVEEVEEVEDIVEVVDAAAESEYVEQVDEEKPDERSEASDFAAIEGENDVDPDRAEPASAVLETQTVSGPAGPAGPQGPPGAATIKGSQNFLVKFRKETEGGNSQIYDNGNQVGIGTTEPKQRLEVNGSIQIHEQNSSVAGLMITQSAGETGYIMHNRASTLTIGAGSQDRITIDRDGNVGIGASKPSHPIEMASGAHVTAGGVWTNSSSRDKKENIAVLSAEQALVALGELEPVLFNYRNDRRENYVGFIAEDVPDLVATHDRKALSPMDIVAVLTKVVQSQQQRIEELEARLNGAGR